MGSGQTTSNTELSLKLERIHGLLNHCGLDALLLQRFSNFAWATCSAACYINTADLVGNASLLVTPVGRFVLTNNIEASRLMQEEGLADQGWEFVVSPWFEREDKVSELTRGMRLASDISFPNAEQLTGEVAALRFALTQEEGERFRKLAGSCAAGMWKAVVALQPGMTEYEIAGLLSEAVESRGVQGNEIITEMANWPSIEIQVGSQTIKRPAILEREPS